MPFASLSKLSFFNFSTASSDYSPSTTTSTQASCFMSSCSFSSVCNAYDGGIVPSLNNPFASLTASNTSFVGCCRTRNIECIGEKNDKLTPGRQNATDNGVNSFIWCEWSGSKATEKSEDYSNQASNGGAIFMHTLTSGTLSISHCAFNECSSYWCGGGIMCNTIRAVTIESSTLNCCVSTNRYGGGVYILSASFCARVSGCEFKNCQAIGYGGGLKLENFQVSETGCIGTENGEGESACVFDCSFTSCSVTNIYGGGMCCATVPATQFKMRSIQFISCSARQEGGGLFLQPNRATAPDNKLYCFFLFFHECSCRDANNPRGHDAEFADTYNLYLESGNPFYECYTTNTDDKRVCLAYYPSGTWTYDQTSKKDWLKDKTIYVSVNGNDNFELCGANETFPCLTVKKAFEMSEVQINLAITLLDGNHQSEATTIEIGSKKISVIGKGREAGSIETGALSSTGALFNVSTGHLGMRKLKIDCNSNANPSSPSVVVVSYRSGIFSLEF
ncbi:uncharacterized protein MONOS_16543 [Monocercomonoides exilis]|uniref:uncharacterized protein n=1 Tax=Monocercomonoides exilis TaxID=2049356 RepID=UPI0035597016|nr:hypothetical protein MONOS_16543 [Monocercomonoides exilis]|eukprot:MONOS_16543.1-p1 / transcript=MONOS_16543.1 / gene=MONOS_16543 / organism=Monocercomonoides_exilis_PA203 / gene_product=unspecified product / transcript_product=unspecified product / location=Mono_scaffold01848:2013-3527(+) / protein_length=505 / sequence_SO=supercontig / SO=protein_coding / is_pseudo=false